MLGLSRFRRTTTFASWRSRWRKKIPESSPCSRSTIPWAEPSRERWWRRASNDRLKYKSERCPGSLRVVHAENQFHAGAEFHVSSRAGNLRAAGWTAVGRELEVWQADNNSGMDGVGRPAGIEIFVVCGGRGDG